jgi:DNA-binding NtrC family response regulator
MIDSLENLSEKERESFINAVLTDSQIRKMLTTPDYQPLSFKEDSATLSPEAPSPERVDRYCNVMLVDDDRDTLMTLEAILEPYRINVKTFDSSYDALKDFLNTEPHTYDLVILDIKIPGLNGLQLYQRFRAIDDGVKILFLSGLALRDELVTMLPDVPLSNVIGKPVTGDDFIEVITRELPDLLASNKLEAGAS